MIKDVASITDGASYDVIVAGAGAAGLAAALFAAIEGQRVLLIERTAFLGGTSALSAATIWIPGTPHGKTVNPDDNFDNARRFLSATVGNHSSAAMRDAFLEAGPKAVATLEAHSDLKFRPFATHPDYEQHFEGATMRGRAIEPLPFDGRVLGPVVNRIRPPIPEFTLFGGMMVDRVDITHLLNMRSKAASLAHAAKILARYGRDRLTGSKRGTRLLMGNALVGRFVKSLLDRDVDMLLETEVSSFDLKNGRIGGVTIKSGGLTRTLKASKAVVLAGGGFGRHATRRAEMLSDPTPAYSPAAPGHTGALQDLAVAIGARFGDGAVDNAFWAPVSVRQRPDGTTAVFPHFVLDRSKPGTVCVNQKGARFTNESNSYHVFARAMREAHKTSPTVPCYIITDADGLRTYGLGMVRMGTRNLAPYLADGYLTEGASLAELAQKLGMDVNALSASVAAINSSAVTGVDTEFGRGTTGYHRHNGDATRGPNPTLGAIKTPPFYAVRLWPGDIGAATGLAISPDAEVLGAGDQPITGLYACGNEAQSIMGGVYPGPGITLGPAITFAYRAIHHAILGSRGSEASGRS